MSDPSTESFLAFGDLEYSKFFNIFVRSGIRVDMKYHVLHDFITSTPFEEKSSDLFEDLHKMELLTNFDISLRSFLGGAMN